MKRGTKLEFIKQGQALTHTQSRLVARWGIPLVPLTLFVLGLLPRNGPNGVPDEPTPVFYIALTCLFGLGVAAVAHVAMWEQRLVRRCPECRRRFTPITAALAIASDRCGECGGRVFGDVWDEAANSALQSRSNVRSGLLPGSCDLIEQGKVHERRRDRAAMVALAVGITSVLATTAATIGMANRDDLVDLVIRMSILALLMPLHVVLIVFMARLGNRRGYVPVPPRCPECRQPLPPTWLKFALITHHCGHCGGRVIADDRT